MFLDLCCVGRQLAALANSNFRPSGRSKLVSLQLSRIDKIVR